MVADAHAPGTRKVARRGPFDPSCTTGFGRAATRVALATSTIGLMLSIWMALRSDGVHHDDDVVHFQMAAWSIEYPAYLLHAWGRPGFTLLYVLPAQLGWTAARVCTGILTALTGWFAFRIAARQRIALAGWVPALLWLQPLTFPPSYTTLTEPVLAFYLSAALWLFLRGKYASSAATISLGMVTRHEGALFVALWALALWRRRRPPRDWLWLGWAPLTHNVLSAVFLGKVPLLMYLAPRPTDEYGHGGWLAMLARRAPAWRRPRRGTASAGWPARRRPPRCLRRRRCR